MPVTALGSGALYLEPVDAPAAVEQDFETRGTLNGLPESGNAHRGAHGLAPDELWKRCRRTNSPLSCDELARWLVEAKLAGLVDGALVPTSKAVEMGGALVALGLLRDTRPSRRRRRT
jgi:hypothetical protein